MYCCYKRIFKKEGKLYGTSRLFVILFVLQSFRENYKYAKALDWISIIGLSFSLLGLVVTIVHHLEYK